MQDFSVNDVVVYFNCVRWFGL